MKCSNIRSHLYRFADGESPAEEQQRIELHLQSCSACQKEFKQIQELNSILTEEETIEVPSWLHERIMSRVREVKPERRGFTSLRWKLVPVTLSVVASLYLGLTFGTRTLPLTVAQSEISTLDYGQATLSIEDDSQEF